MGRRVKHKVKHRLSRLTQLHKSESLRSSRFSKANLTVFAIVFASIGGYLIFRSFAAVPTTANLWIDTNGGSCSYSASAGAYSDAAACASFDQAYDVIRAATGSTCGGNVLIKAGTYPGQNLTGYRTCSSNNPTVFQPENFDCDLTDWPTANTPVILTGGLSTGGNIFNDSPQNAISNVTFCGITTSIANVPNTNPSGTVNDNSRYGISATASYRVTFKRMLAGGFSFFWNGFTYNTLGPSGNITVINSNIERCHEYSAVCGNGKIDGAQNILIEHNYIHDFRSLANCTSGGAVDCGHQEPMFLNFTEGVSIKRNRFWNNEQSASGAYITISGYSSNVDIVGSRPAHKDLLIENNWGESPHNTCPGCQAPNEGGERGEPLFGPGHCEGAPAGQQYVNIKIRNNTAIGEQGAIGFGGGRDNISCTVPSGGVMITGNIANQIYNNNATCTNLIYEYNIASVYPTLGKNQCGSNQINNVPIGDIVVNGNWGDVNQDAHLKSATTVASGYVPAQYCPAEDFHGNPRPLASGFCAAGAFEYGSTAAGPPAHIWVDQNGGSCQRNSSQVTYDDPNGNSRSCSSFGAAYSIAQTGDTVRIKSGNYPKQGSIGGTAKTNITFIGEENTVVDSGSESGTEGNCSNPAPNTCAYNTLNLGGNITLDNVDVTGDTPIFQVFGSNSTWKNSSMTGREARHCSPSSDEPIIVQDGDAPQGVPTILNTTFSNIYVGSFTGVATGCGDASDPHFHLEQMRIGKGVSGVVIENSTFAACNGNGSTLVGCGSGHIFLTYSDIGDNGSSIAKNVTIRNNKFFGANGVVHTSGSRNYPQALNWTLAYNTMMNEPVIDNTQAGSASNIRLIGNVGPRPQNCYSGYTFIENLWQTSSGNTCGSDSTVPGSSSGLSPSSLSLDSTTLNPQAGSPVINAAETPGANDYCTDPAGLASRDIFGNNRPSGSECDAGAVEYTGSTSPNPTPPTPPTPPVPPPNPGPSGTFAFGRNTTSGLIWSTAGGDYRFGNTWVASQDGTTSSAKWYVRGGSGSTSARAVLYQASGDGLGQIGAFVAASSPVTISSNQAEGWVAFPITAQLTAGQRYLVGFWSSGGADTAYLSGASANNVNHYSPLIYNSTGDPAGGSNWANDNVSTDDGWLAYVEYAASGPKIGDINNDGSVNITDLSFLLSSYGNNVAACTTNNSYTCDISTSGASAGKVDIFDLSLLLSGYGT